MTKSTLPPFHVLIAAAGNARRMGHDTPKPYLKINNKSILRHSIEKFISFDSLISLKVIIHPDHQELYNETVQGLNLAPPIIGSNSRKSSIYNGLKSFSKVKTNDTILIHDAARPMVQEAAIIKLLETMQTASTATLASPVTDTLYREGKTVERKDLWAIQTPQAFKLEALIKAHEKFKDNNSFTDDAGLMRAIGHKVEIVSAPRNNIKITTREDFDMVQAMMTANSNETRIASGFDVHAFEPEPSARKLMLGGIEIPHRLALAGHSDADIVLHAVTDALLGTINEGDIGTHFPPSDPQWKDTNSAVFLKKAAKMLLGKGAAISFLDITIIAEEPKIGPHRTAMQKNIAAILKISPERISIKATTTEQLGFTGRKEGMACQALATVLLPA